MPLELLLAVSANLLSSAIWDLLFDPTVGAWRPDPRQASALELATQSAVEQLSPLLRKVSSADETAVAEFLGSTETRNLIGQLYRTALADAHPSFLTLRQSFVALWGLQHPDRVRAVSAYDLFDALVAGCEKVLREAIVAGDLSAHEASSAARQKQLLDRLTAMERQMGLLRTRDPAAPSEIADDEERLRAQVVDALSHITPPNHRGERDVPLDDIFVAPNFRGGASETYSYYEVIDRCHRLVVRGDPGAGKSTFARKLSRDLARRDESINDGATPVILFLELRAYARDCELQPRSIRDYLTDLIKSQYQVDIPGSTLEYLLTAGRLGVAFDGLDELPVVAQRRTIRDSIEAFATRYSLAPIIVTSRLVGYEHAALSLDSFNHLQLASFDNEQVEEYAALWFSVDGRYSDADLDRTVEAFISESLSAPDLRVNPLMLGLMCVLYRGQGYIPRNRPELYRQCATFLFETWDRHRGIVTEKPFERLVRPALRELAYWIYTNPNLQRGVPYEAAIRKTTKFLVDLDFGDEILAEDAARSFIDFCRGRAWVFTDVGTDASDRDVFAFTHRTFLEFFTAERILDRTETTGALLRVLRPRIYAAEWDVVPQLAIQIHEERHLRSADKCLKQLIETAPDAMSRSNALGFDVRALQAVIPSPSTTGEIVAAVFEELGTAYNYYRSSIKAGQTPDPGPLQTAQDMFLGLFRCDAEARTAVADAIQAALARWLALGPKDELAVLACELALSGHLVAEDALRLSISEQRVWWMERLHRLADSLEGSLTAITLALPSCAALRCAVGRSDISDLVSTHGIPGLFWTPRATLHMHALHSAAQQILTGNARSDDATAVGTTLCAAPTPWISEHVLGGLVLSWSDFRRTEPAGAGMTASTLLLCALVEPALDGPQHPSSWPGIALLDSVNEGLMSDLRAEERALTLAERILLARGEPDEADEMRGELHAAGYEPACIEALEGWIRRDISFVRRES